MKKTLCLLLSLILLIGALPVTARAEIIASGECGINGGNVTYTLDNTGKLTISGSGDMNDYWSYVKPWESYKQQINTVVIEDGVTSIGTEAFYYYTGLKSVSIPGSVTIIKDGAFYECSELTSVTMQEGVKSIGWRAFSGCSRLKSIVIPNSVTNIGKEAFSGCISLKSAEIQNGVGSIGESAFSGCTGLTDITIPGSVTSIEGEAFSGCTELKRVTMLKGVQSIGESAFYSCSNLTKIMIPSSVTSIGKLAFGFCKQLTYVFIPNSVTSIGWGAFGHSGLKRVTIPSSMTSVGDHAFYGCPDLADVTISNSVTSIGEMAFCGCTALTSITIPNSVTSIYYESFDGCQNLRCVIIPGSVTYINKLAFRDCNNVTLYVDAGSAAYDFAVENGIRYVFRDSATVTYEHGDKTYRAPFSPMLFSEPSTRYNQDLAMLAGMLSWEIENINLNVEKEERPLYEQLGIPDEDTFTSYIDYGWFAGKSLCATICVKPIEIDGEETNLLIITTRGTKTALEGVEDVFTHHDAEFCGETAFNAYNIVFDFYSFVLDRLEDFKKDHSDIEKKPLKVLITGHSLGGAAANLLGAYYTKKADADKYDLLDKEDVFVYTFGAIDSIDTDGTVSKGYENIHNITNFFDTFGPSGNEIIKPAGNTRYGKYGHIDLFRCDRFNILRPFINHEMDTYLDAVRNRGVEYEKEQYQKYASWQCPVDVKIYSNGELVGQVTDNEVIESVTTIPIIVVDDRKYALLEYDCDYTFEITATDSGSLTYFVADTSTGEVLQQYENVSLEKGKAMRSDVSPDAEPEDVKLVVVDAKGTVTAEIGTNGVEKVYAPGDVDGIGGITAADARLVLRCAVGLESFAEDSLQYRACDVDNDGNVTAADARMVLRAAVGLEDPGSWGK